jgi:Na+/H+-dicarboxylate symporter
MMKKLGLYIPLHYQILITLIAGGFFGYFFSSATSYTNWIGDIFLRALNMIIIPLILTSVITGVASVGSKGNLGRLGLKTIGYYILSSIAAIITGFLLVSIIKPGVGADLGLTIPTDDISVASDSFGSTLIEIVPTNILNRLLREICFQSFSLLYYLVSSSPGLKTSRD